MAQHDLLRELVVEVCLAAVAREVWGQHVQRRHLGARAPREDRGQPEVVHVLVADDQELEVLDRVAQRSERLLEFVERLGGVGPGVHERQRIVLDQVGVDATHLKRGRDREPVDPGIGGCVHEPVMSGSG